MNCVVRLKYFDFFKHLFSNLGHNFVAIDLLAVKNTGVTDDTITHDKTEYSSHALAIVLDGKTRISKSWAHDPGMVSHKLPKIDKR